MILQSHLLVKRNEQNLLRKNNFDFDDSSSSEKTFKKNAEEYGEFDDDSDKVDLTRNEN